MARRGKMAICFRWGAYRGEKVRDNLAGRGRYKRCSGNPFDEMQVVAMQILRSFFNEHPELLPDYFSDLMDGDFFGSDDAEAAGQLINDQLEALDEEKERYLEAWEEERRALKRKSYEIRHAKRRRLEEEGSEMSED